MSITDQIKKAVSRHFNAETSEITPLGKGASGKVFYVKLNKEPFELAVKVSEHYELIKEEKEMLDFLQPRVFYKVPETYFLEFSNKTAFLAMEYIKGISGNSKKLMFLPNKKRLAENILFSLTETQKRSDNKFGSYLNPEYDTWEEYYYNFFCEIYEFSKEKYKGGALDEIVVDALELTKNNFFKIFPCSTNKSYLCHGDFWMCNMLIDFKKADLAGVLDPFNVIWAEPEYELFALTLGYGKTLKLYERYKQLNPVSEHCDLKVELYALCNELHWYKKLGSIDHNYLKYRAKRLIDLINKIIISC